jgi:O-succinylbenzoate synthase
MSDLFKCIPYRLDFKTPVLTSRGKMESKSGWFISREKEGQKQWIAEAHLLEGLSHDDENGTVGGLFELTAFLNGQISIPPVLNQAASFAAETAMNFLFDNGYGPTESRFYQGMAGIPINGLIWMGTTAFMEKQIREKISAGFRCIKMKVGALPFEDEMLMISKVLNEFKSEKLIWRLDANGAFEQGNVFEHLEQLAEYEFHSIEQPIKPGQNELMAEVCERSPIPVALDEELIAPRSLAEKQKLIEILKPAYLILKPGIMGGFQACEEWIEVGKRHGCGWWATSALESNIGLNAIAQWAYQIAPETIHGLGTGGLYTRNVSSPLEVSKGHLFYRPEISWSYDLV